MDVLKVSTLNPLVSRNYNLPPPGFVEEIPYAVQVCSSYKICLFHYPNFYNLKSHQTGCHFDNLLHQVCCIIDIFNKPANCIFNGSVSAYYYYFLFINCVSIFRNFLSHALISFQKRSKAKGFQLFYCNLYQIYKNYFGKKTE